ncbi:MAG: Asp-tRNA(Asn)/Glu-tRNA(Gln) amidotransferase subunit GatC [Christensenellaceae bacterium]|jgi:aspartyl-tRNA(Asn)/glutamyl-tRNA(Gln) amidotransferase subunit C|nr:Asp-tRNA(Asn)/Glu-tRNA(Gln) amidotransferase subunit GatC [Christensenellaceae bacterium]
METVDLEEVRHLARLSALKFGEAELKEFIPQFNNILKMVGQIADAEAKGELEYPDAVDVSQLREDKVGVSMPQKLALINAPKQRKGQYNVPKVVD